jgi:hypothetical protein
VSRRIILFNSLDHARAAVAAAAELDVPMTLQSAPGAAAYAGVGFLKAVVDQATADGDFGDGDIEAAIDCGEDAGTALAALRAGWTRVVFSGPAEVLGKLADIAAQQGARVAAPDAKAAALDLLDVTDPLAACGDFLGAEKN